MIILFRWMKDEKKRKLFEFVFWFLFVAPVAIYGFYETFFGNKTKPTVISVVAEPAHQTANSQAERPKLNTSLEGEALLVNPRDPIMANTYTIDFTTKNKVNVSADFLSGVEGHYVNKDDSLLYFFGFHFQKAQCMKIKADDHRSIRFHCINLYAYHGLKPDNENELEKGLEFKTIMIFRVTNNTKSSSRCYLYILDHNYGVLHEADRREFISIYHNFKLGRVKEPYKYNYLRSIPNWDIGIPFDDPHGYYDKGKALEKIWPEKCDINLEPLRQRKYVMSPR